jgi:hypothetical protein
VNDGVGTASILVQWGGIGITINAPAGDAGRVLDDREQRYSSCHRPRHFFLYEWYKYSLGIEYAACRQWRFRDSRLPDRFRHRCGRLQSSRVEHNAIDGILLDGSGSTGTLKATVVDSVAAGKGGAGFSTNSAAGQAVTTFTLFHSVTANNDTGIRATNTGATLRVAQLMVTGNTTGWDASAGAAVIETYGDNYIDGNGSNIGVLTPVAKQWRQRAAQPPTVTFLRASAQRVAGQAQQHQWACVGDVWQGADAVGHRNRHSSPGAINRRMPLSIDCL